MHKLCTAPSFSSFSSSTLLARSKIPISPSPVPILPRSQTQPQPRRYSHFPSNPPLQRFFPLPLSPSPSLFPGPNPNPILRISLPNPRYHSTTTMTMHKLNLPTLKNIPEKLEVEIEDIPDAKILLIKSGDTIHALSARCTHYGAPLKGGVVEGGRITCPWHGGEYIRSPVLAWITQS